MAKFNDEEKKVEFLHMRLTRDDRRTLVQLATEIDRERDTLNRMPNSAIGRAMVRFALLNRPAFVAFVVANGGSLEVDSDG